MRDGGVPSALKKFVALRAGGRCEYCRTPERYSPSPFAVEHILPIARGGASVAENLAFSCQGCNNHKFTRIEGFDPVTERAAPLFDPRNQLWTDHFEWNEEAAEIRGLTPSGRATVIALQLNREGLRNLREIMRDWDVHPEAGQ